MKKNILLATITGIILVTVFSSCYYDIEEELYPASGGTACDTTGVTYSGTVAPLMQSQCISCHSAGFASGNVALDSYNAVKTVALNGKLYGTINYSAGYSPMPQGGNKMNSCSIARIQTWINAGAPNN